MQTAEGTGYSIVFMVSISCQYNGKIKPLTEAVPQNLHLEKTMARVWLIKHRVTRVYSKDFKLL